MDKRGKGRKPITGRLSPFSFFRILFTILYPNEATASAVMHDFKEGNADSHLINGVGKQNLPFVARVKL